MNQQDFFPGAIAAGFDPWIGTVEQTRKIRALCQIVIDGVDVTDRLDPHQLSLHIIDTSPEYQCEIELDDRDGRLPLPPIGAPVTAKLGWAHDDLVRVFNGQVGQVESGFGRKQSGRRLWVHCFGTNYLTTKIKSPMQNHWGEGAPPGSEQGSMIPFSQVAKELAKSAGAVATIHPSFAGIMRDYWAQGNESAMHFFQRHANEFGAWTRVQDGNNMVITKPGEDPGGGPTGTVPAKWGDSLIAWRIQPLTARTTWGASVQQYFSTRDGAWNVLKKQFGLTLPWSKGTAPFGLPAPAPNSGVAGQHNDGRNLAGQTGAGQGRIAINGDPRAQWNGSVDLIGARPGIDGRYLIMSAEHIYSRQGYVTWLDVFANAGSGGSVGSQGWGGPPAQAPNSSSG